MNTRSLCWGVAVCWAANVAGGEFINLGFDDPDLSHVRPWKPPTAHLGALVGQWAPVDEVFRGWTVDSGAMLEGYPYYGLVSVDGLYGKPFALSPVGPPRGGYVVNASYTSYFDYYRFPFSLSQVGTVPADAALLVMLGGVEVSMNGTDLALITPAFWSYTYADVSSFAGKEVELTLRFPGGSDIRFDIIGFQPIPEPATWGLMLLGGWLTLGWLRRRRSG